MVRDLAVRGRDTANGIEGLTVALFHRYDGSFEPKTEAEFKRDIFLYKQEVKPATDRLKTLTLACAALWVASCVGLKASYSLKPIFNE